MIAELFTLQPLFPGTSEIDEIFKICSLCGSPTRETYDSGISVYSKRDYDNNPIPPREKMMGGGPWQDGIKLASTMGFKFPNIMPVPVAKQIPNAPDIALQIIADMILYDPDKRPTASEAINHPWFTDLRPKTQATTTSKTLYNKTVERAPVLNEYGGNQKNVQMPTVKNLISSYYSPCSNSKPEIDIDDYEEGYRIKEQPPPEKFNQNRKSESAYHTGKKSISAAKKVVRADQFQIVDPGPPKPIQNARKYPVAAQPARASMPLVSKADEDFILVCHSF
jgi:serine/threonine protein kinase